MPGSDDTTNPNISILAHEVGHFFNLQHINGKWFFDKDNAQRELVSGENCNELGDFICDTPGSPGEESSRNWDIDECIYHGYGGEYVDSTGILKIGGYNKISPIPINYNYCSQWGLPGDPHKTEPPYYIRAFDTTDSLIPPGCGNLITFDLEGVPIALSDISVRDSLGKYIEFSYYENPLINIANLCDGYLPDMYLFITEDGNVFYKSSESISEFQFNIVGARILGVNGGKVQENNFDIQFDHCNNYTNYDNDGYFFGTGGVDVECINDDQSEFAAECLIDNYVSPDGRSSLPIGHNFM